MTAVHIKKESDMSFVGSSLAPYAKEFMVGIDPEMFVFDGPKLMPAFEFLPSKEQPYVRRSDVSSVQPAAYWDGFQAEFRLQNCAPMCLMVLSVQARKGLKLIIESALKTNKNAKLSLQNVVRIPSERLKTDPDPFVELGCEPSFNIYGLKGKKVSNPRQLRYRFAGGHMHFGTTSKYDFKEVIPILDAILGVWSVGAAQSFDNPIRRKYYGLVGEYRKPVYKGREGIDTPDVYIPAIPKGNGLEYRVLSNFYYASPAIFHLTWEIGRQAIRLAHDNPKFFKAWSSTKDETIECIQNSDIKMAQAILKRNEPMFKWLFGQRGWDSSIVQRGFNVGLNGIESEIKDPTEIEKNWGLEDIEELSLHYNHHYYWHQHCENQGAPVK